MESSQEESVLLFQKNDTSGRILYDSNWSIERSEVYCVEISRLNNSIFIPIDYVYFMVSFIISFVLSVFGCFPYVTIELYVDDIDWVFFHLLRAITYWIIFASFWMYYSYSLFTSSAEDIYKKCYNLRFVLKSIISFLFAALYSGMYSLKWIKTEKISARYLSISCFVLSWFLVFYQIMNIRLSSGKSSNNTISRKREALLLSIRRVEKILWSKSDTALILEKEIKEDPCVSLLIGKLSNTDFFPNPSERLDIYEEDTFDRYERIRSSITNFSLGLSLIPLAMSMLEEYGYYLKLLIDDELVFLICAGIFSFVLACLYILSTYNIHHKGILIITSIPTCMFNNPKQFFWKFIRRIPLYFLSGVAASIRLNSSFMIFARIVAHQQVPRQLGLPIVWTCVVCVFLIDYSACLKILSLSVKRVLGIFCFAVTRTRIFEFIKCIKCLYWLVCYYAMRYYAKKAKSQIRECEDDDICVIAERLL